MSLEQGTQLGPYRIEGSVGAGGMGEVYRALDTRLDRHVAIKVLPSHLSEHPELKQRFDREAKTISSLQHPNICSLYDVGHENGTDFLVMEYLEGETLASRLSRGKLPAEEVTRIGVQVTEALHAAHRNGVVHRDLKPGNIMLTRAGAKLLDFGLAKISAVASAPSSSFTELATEQASGPLTEKGTLLGTFQYMSPEQLEGKEADARSDIFSLGAVLYEMITGVKAFQGESQASLIAAIMSSQPQPISSVQPMSPPALDRVVRTCLEKDPDHRWQTAHDVALQLKFVMEGGSEVGVPRTVSARRRLRERSAWIVAIAAIAVAVALVAMKLFEPTPEPPIAVRFQIEAPLNLTSFGSPRMSPDGRFIAFNATDSLGAIMMWIRPMNSLTAYPLPGTEGCSRPFWSPDSRHVGFFASSKLKRVPIAGGPPLTVCEFGRGADGAWGDGFILFDGTFGDSIQVVPAGGGTPRGATTLDREHGDRGHGWPFFLPDGKHFVFIAFFDGQPNQIRIAELGSTESRMITHGDSRVEYSPPGYLIYERSGTLLAQPFDASAGELTGDAFALTEGIGTGGLGLAHFSTSANGGLIFTTGDSPERQLAWFDRNGRELDVVGEAAQYATPAISPDGKRMIVTISDEATGTDDLWMIDLRRRVRSRFTFDDGEDRDGTWSPDGKRIAFTSNRGGDFDVYVKDAAATGPEQVVFDTPEFTAPCEWSRDGKVLTVHGLRSERSFDVEKLTLEPEVVATGLATESFAEAQGRLSPDGRFLAYAAFATDRWEVYLISLSERGGKWQVSTAGGTEPMWRADGREIFYVAPDRGLMAVDVSLQGVVEIGMPQRLFTAPVPRDTNTRNRYAVTPDGERFLAVALVERDRVPPLNIILNWTTELSDR